MIRCSSLQYFYMKIIVIVIPTNIYTQICFFILILLSIAFKDNNQIFSRLVVWLGEINLLFVYSESRSNSKVCRIQWTFIKKFFNMLILFLLEFHADKGTKVWPKPKLVILAHLKVPICCKDA